MRRVGFPADKGNAAREGTVSDRASRASFSRSAPRGRTLRTHSRSPTRERPGGHESLFPAGGTVRQK